MKPQRIEFIVYFVGVLLLGFVYYMIKSAVSGPVFVVGVLAYLVALRVLGRYLAKRSAAKVAHGDSDV